MRHGAGEGYHFRKSSKKATNVKPMLSAEEILSLPANEPLARLNASTTGLSSQEAEKRLEIYGGNELAKKKKQAAIFTFLTWFKST
jgi:magnesium-transporting ATPase (P-type)